MWQTWLYNDTVGWIRLYLIDSKFRYDYVALDLKRLTKRRRTGRFVHKLKMISVDVSTKGSSEEVFASLKNWLEKLQTEPPFKGRFLDLRAFLNLGCSVDWRKVVESEAE